MEESYTASFSRASNSACENYPAFIYFVYGRGQP